MATCRDCAHYNLDTFRIANGKLRVVRGKTARCLFDMSRLARKFPVSYRERDRAHHLMWMAPTDGNGCPQWTARKQEAGNAD